MKGLAGKLDAELKQAGSPERAKYDAAYLKSAATHYGVTLPHIRRIAKAVGKLARSELLAVVDDLWREEVHERRMMAVELLTIDVRALVPADLKLLRTLIGDAQTWALVDALAVKVVGGLVEREGLHDRLDAWAKDPNMWIRRAAMLALLEPLRRGEGDWERFTRYADALLGEKELFIRKAIGWVLRETGKKRPALVRAWIEPRRARASGLTYREAMKSQPDAKRRTKKVGLEDPH